MTDILLVSTPVAELADAKVKLQALKERFAEGLR